MIPDNETLLQKFHSGNSKNETQSINVRFWKPAEQLRSGATDVEAWSVNENEATSKFLMVQNPTSGNSIGCQREPPRVFSWLSSEGIDHLYV